MFDLIDDRKRPEIKWWTLPAAVFIVFCAGVDAGILLGGRNTDPSDWLQFAFLILISCLLLWPIGRELVTYRTPAEKNDGQ